MLVSTRPPIKPWEGTVGHNSFNMGHRLREYKHFILKIKLCNSTLFDCEPWYITLNEWPIGLGGPGRGLLAELDIPWLLWWGSWVGRHGAVDPSGQSATYPGGSWCWCTIAATQKHSILQQNTHTHVHTQTTRIQKKSRTSISSEFTLSLLQALCLSPLISIPLSFSLHLNNSFSVSFTHSFPSDWVPLAVSLSQLRGE